MARLVVAGLMLVRRQPWLVTGALAGGCAGVRCASAGAGGSDAQRARARARARLRAAAVWGRAEQTWRIGGVAWGWRWCLVGNVVTWRARARRMAASHPSWWLVTVANIHECVARWLLVLVA